jgi:16S rRNA (guanine(966)-N(2))-methyltransferase RsmD
MRIIAGTYKGHFIHPPAWFKARPTTDRAKEALFNILTHTVGLEEIDVLDLFAGSGGMSFEFASRGAASLTCVDQHHKTAVYIKEQFLKLKYPNYLVRDDDVLTYLRKETKAFDIIFADPPYAWPYYDILLKSVFDNHLLKEGGMLVLEHISGLHLPKERLLECRQYGQSAFSFYK